MKLFTNFFIGWIQSFFKVKHLSIKAKISKGANLEKGVYSLGDVVISSKATIGKGTYINSGIMDRAKIGRYCSISYNVLIGLREHDYNFETMSPVKSQELYGDSELANKPCKNAIIEDEVWIGANVTVLQGVTVGHGAVIGAGSVVTKSIPAYEIWAGVPAKKISTRDR